ncbi:hypothetical protein INR49_025342 [Caranx melampygus]|nr:hypothetical protein INR49_025342 [Caranx melampygus]
MQGLLIKKNGRQADVNKLNLEFINLAEQQQFREPLCLWAFKPATIYKSRVSIEHTVGVLVCLEPFRPSDHSVAPPVPAGMTLNTIKSFTLDLDGPADAAFIGGEVVSGQVILELRRETRVHSMKVQGRGVATAHWLENRGMNSVYNDYTSKITYFRKRQHLIRETFTLCNE